MSPEAVPLVPLVAAIASALLGSVFATADTALTSLSSARLGALIEQSEGATRATLERIRRADVHLRVRYLLGRILFLALSAILFARFFDAYFTLYGPYLALGVSVCLSALLTGAGTTLARRYADRAAPGLARALRPLELALMPLATPLGWLGVGLGPREGEHSDPRVTEAEVELMVEEGQRSGFFDSEPAALIRNVLEFADRTARDVMIPRRKVEGLEVDMPLDRVLEVVSKSGHSRYPVYKEELDEVVGLLYAKDLFRVLDEDRRRDAGRSDAPPPESGRTPVARSIDDLVACVEQPHTVRSLKEIVRAPANFVPESQPLSALLREMRGRRQHLAIVVDEFGGVSGIVTLEDVLEEIVGDIRDEHDDVEDAPIRELGDGRLVADADVSVSDLSAYLGAVIPKDSAYDSLGGMLTHHLGRIPEVGTAISKFGLRFIVRDSDERHIGKVEIIRPGPVETAIL